MRLALLAAVAIAGAWRAEPLQRPGSQRAGSQREGLQRFGPPVALASFDPQTTSSTASSWLNCWFPVTFAEEVREGSLTSATIFERPLVLFRDEHGDIHCLADQCPHRLAPLSEGRLATDAQGAKRVECSYHGWQFSGCGRCTKLPQLDASKRILPLYDAHAYPVACSQGIVHVFLGDGDHASAAVPRVPELDQNGWIYEQDYRRDLPYDYTTLVENIIDPSHVPVSHHGTVQGNRDLAQPLATRVRTASLNATSSGGLPLGFDGETEVPLHASTRLGFAQQTARQRVTFTAPSLLTYRFSVAAGDACALFYPIPVARGRSRILVRRARNFATDRPMTRAALVAKHLENNVVFDQDMAFLRGQEARLQSMHPDGWGGAWRAHSRTDASAVSAPGGTGGGGANRGRSDGSGGSGGRGYVMPAEADRFVIAFRKQLDDVAATLPWRSQPNAHAAYAPTLPRTALLDRYEQHTKGCAHCLHALALTEQCIRVATVTAQLSAMAALVAVVSRAVPPARFLLLCATAASAFSAMLLRAYVVGPVIGALSNRVAATPFGAAALALACRALLPSAGPVAHACAALLPLITAGCAAWSARALERLRSRFLFTEEAKALQDS